MNFDQVFSLSHYSWPLLLLSDRFLFLLFFYHLVISSPHFALSSKGTITRSQRKGAKHWLKRSKQKWKSEQMSQAKLPWTFTGISAQVREHGEGRKWPREIFKILQSL